MSMIYGDVCTGGSAATLAWHSLGWKPAFFSEIEPFPCKLLKYHYPHVPNLGDMLKLHENEQFQKCTIDILVGGTPCQSFSVAGLRGGLSDIRGNLALEYCRILVTKRPRWFVWENVPGALSSFSNAADGPNLAGVGHTYAEDITETSDFAAILAAFRECGYCCAYRVLDAQYFGVPQRRRRIFVVGYFGSDWRPPAAVLFEPNSMPGNFEAGRKAGEEIAGALNTRSKGRSPGADDAAAGHVIVGTLDARTKGGGFPGSDGAMSGHVVPMAIRTANNGAGGSGINEAGIAYTLDTNGNDGQAVLYEPASLLNENWKKQDVKNTLRADASKNSHVIAYPYNQITSFHNRSNPQPGDPSPSLTKTSTIFLVPAVRRLTPLECERLQGFPDGYTNIPGCSDTSRYQLIGNSMAVPVMEWIGKRIDLVDKFLKNMS